MSYTGGVGFMGTVDYACSQGAKKQREDENEFTSKQVDKLVESLKGFGGGSKEVNNITININFNATTEADKISAALNALAQNPNLSEIIYKAIHEQQ